MITARDIRTASNEDLRQAVERGVFRRPPGSKRQVAELASRIWGAEDPYRDVVHDPLDGPSRLVGPHQDDPTLPLLIAELRPRRIVEIGSFHGASAVRMAKTARAQRADAEVLCVDPWRSVSTPWLRPKWGQRMRNAFANFKTAVVSHDLAHVITYLPTTSVEGWKVCRHHGLTFDFAYIDGDHAFKECRQDLAMWSQLMNDDGVMVVDDYEPGRFQSVVDAVTAFCAESPWRCAVSGRRAVLTQ